MTVLRAETIDSLRRQLGDDGDELVRQLIRLYLDQSRELLAQIEAAAATADVANLRLLAHKLKGGTATLGGDRLADVCQRLEDERAKPAEIERATRELRTELAELERELGGYIRHLRRTPAPE